MEAGIECLNGKHGHVKLPKEPQQIVIIILKCVVSIGKSVRLMNIFYIIFFLQEIKFLYEPTFLGMLTAQYYLSYKTISFLSVNMEPDSSMEDLLNLIVQVEEYRLLPVRHNEDNINK